MEKKTKIVLLGAGIVVLAGIALTANYAYRQGMKLYNTCYSFAGAIIRKLSLNQVDLTLMVRLLNRSDITVDIKKQVYYVYFNGLLVSTIKKDKRFKWYSRSAQTISLDISFNPQDLLKAGLKNIEAILLDKNKLKISVKSVITASIGIITLKKLEMETSYSLAELLAPSPMDDICKKFK